MFILLVYDIDMKSDGGEKRLRKVSKICEKHGVRVQNSVFELEIDAKSFISFKFDLLKIIAEEDSIRFYKLGKNFKNNIETIGHRNNIEIKEDSAFLF